MSETEGHIVIAGEPAGSAEPVAVTETGNGESVADLIEHPAKVMRIGTMIKQLLEEVRAAPLDDASRNRLKEIHARSIAELAAGLAPELREELQRLTLPFAEGTPSDGELRIAQAQLVGWLEGLFHGIQAAMFSQQQMSARNQQDGQQRALPRGMNGQPGQPGPQGQQPGGAGDPPANPTTSGPYL